MMIQFGTMNEDKYPVFYLPDKNELNQRWINISNTIEVLTTTNRFHFSFILFSKTRQCVCLKFSRNISLQFLYITLTIYKQIIKVFFVKTRDHPTFLPPKKSC